MKTIMEIARVIRSKNCSPFNLTLDIILSDRQYYAALKRSNAVTRELVARLYRIRPEDVEEIIWFDPANAVKINLRRRIASGSPGDSDVYGAQQHAPLLDLKFDI